MAGLASILAPSHKEVALCGQVEVGSKEFRDVVGMVWDWWDGGGLAGYIEFRPQAKKERNRLKGQHALTRPIPPPKF